MARERRNTSNDDAFASNFNNGSDDPAAALPPYTGRYLVVMQEGDTRGNVRSLQESAGLRVASASDYTESRFDAETLDQADALYFDTLGVAVVNAPIAQVESIGAADANQTIIIEPERNVEAFVSSDVTPYLLGYRDAVNQLVESTLLENSDAQSNSGAAGLSWNESQLTWGLQATECDQSPFTGDGIGVAVLDTGLDLNHPDFNGRSIFSASFVKNESVQDAHGHGTHCIGTACGSIKPGTLPRYGVAHRAIIYAGKVLSNKGSGTDATILAGIEWAIRNQCAIISMSLGANVRPNDPYSQVFEIAAQRSLRAGSLIIAAAGNHNPNTPGPHAVSHPANCPSIVAVAALDQQLGAAAFSNAAFNCNGGQVDIAAPGVNIRSSWSQPQAYRAINGTSMATPHVAGIAAMYAQQFPEHRGRALAQLLFQNACRLPLFSRDVGAGLVQAPRN